MYFLLFLFIYDYSVCMLTISIVMPNYPIYDYSLFMYFYCFLCFKFFFLCQRWKMKFKSFIISPLILCAHLLYTIVLWYISFKEVENFVVRWEFFYCQGLLIVRILKINVQFAQCSHSLDTADGSKESHAKSNRI